MVWISEAVILSHRDIYSYHIAVKLCEHRDTIVKVILIEWFPRIVLLRGSTVM